MKDQILAAFMLASTAYGQDSTIEGSVRNIGSAGQSRALVGEKTEVCPIGLGEKLKKLSGYTVQVSGMKNSKDNCLTIQKIEVQKSSRGQSIIQGKLVKADNGWKINDPLGKSFYFPKLPKGMQALVNRDLIVDGVLVGSPTESWKVVSYMINPITE